MRSLRNRIADFFFDTNQEFYFKMYGARGYMFERHRWQSLCLTGYEKDKP